MNHYRLTHTLQAMAEHNIPQMLVSDPAALYYLTGIRFSPGERLLALYLSIDDTPKLFINELFPLQQDIGAEIIRFSDIQDSVAMIAAAAKRQHIMGIDKSWPSRFLLRLMELQGAAGFVNSSFIVDSLRSCKDEGEIAMMRAASSLNDQAMKQLIQQLSVDNTEKDMVKLLAAIYEELGAEGYSFTPIVAYGANAAEPHHSTDSSRVKEGDCILLDIGCKKDGYCADMTRTVFYGYATEEARKVHNLVLEANKRAIAAVKPGKRFCDIDTVARDIITAAGYGQYFTHRTGHSIGLQTHEAGDVSAANRDILQPGMIFSVEPGIYLPGKLGVRIEDLVLVTEDGCEVLNGYNKELIVIEPQA